MLMEAQAAGLPCICSDVVNETSYVVHDLIYRVSLNTPLSEWAEILLRTRGKRPAKAFSIVKQSVFNIEQSTRNLERIYESGTV